jgi:hypothetical protein
MVMGVHEPQSTGHDMVERARGCKLHLECQRHRESREMGTQQDHDLMALRLKGSIEHEASPDS